MSFRAKSIVTKRGIRAMADRVMVVGDGGREDAFARMALDSGYEVYVPESMADIARYHADATGSYGNDPDKIVGFAQAADIDLVFIGPEAPLVDGAADALRAANINVFGVSREAAQFEASKIFTHDFNEKYAIPQPQAHAFENIEQALTWVRAADPLRYVIKADGLAGGKGVVLPETQEEAEATVIGMMDGTLFGEAGNSLLVQERITGREVSIFAMTDDDEILILPATQDHKRLEDADKGPNTGGMGAYIGVPNTVLSAEQMKQIRQRIVEPAFDGMQSEGIEYQGVLFIGIILDDANLHPITGEPTPKVLEYNVRFGDPEAQVLFPTTNEPADLMHNIGRIARGEKLDIPKDYKPENQLSRLALTVCLAGEGYPSKKYEGSREIYGANRFYSQRAVLNHGNTWIDNFGHVHSKGGGRMLYVTGFGPTIDTAAEAAYSEIGRGAEGDGIHTPGMQYRTDIGIQNWRTR